MTLVARLDTAQRRHPVLGFPLAVAYKFVDDQGGLLAALLTYYAFVSLFPALLLLTTISGIVLAGDPGLQQKLVDSTLSEFPVIGQQLTRPGQLSGGTAGVVIGILGALYGGLGVGQAVQNACNTAWAIPRNSRPDPIRSRVKSFVLLLIVGTALLSATILGSWVSSSGVVGSVGGAFTMLGALVINIIGFDAAFRLSTARKLRIIDTLLGSVLAAVIWQLLQRFGTVYVERVIKHASEINSVFAVVLGLLAFLYLGFVAFVICLEINVVRVDHLYPRALLTPFTDNVRLTAGDERVYTTQAQAQRAKGFEEVTVEFDAPAAVDEKRSPTENADG
ncbi:YihY/virulence factor BrkB family protein [Williamsia sterculiae]|uniref:Uncharacterized membrane protein, BrkB/YihY/UPF0761 family (Not an RNase) n=1 Tax=Williamsia sterculiae TaxID=1344003 RepID=A0A1N7HD47_9NOCA|nr:Uncharacterized membrane protein, BrkB/YihY/UPF0761 family (not an RNase) [Williamsia sterculiae]